MALTIAHHTGSTGFTWDDLVEAVTTLDAGTAIGSEYIPMERRAVAIHEAGHAVAGHVYLTGRESTRLTIKKRGDQGVGGHHWMIEKEERLFSFQHEMFHDIVWGLGAMAAERVVYGENSNGVGGDVAGVTARAALMVGRAAMGPQPFHVTPKPGETEEQARKDVLDRFEKIGLQIMSRAGGGGPFEADPIAGVLGDPAKRTVAAQILGQAYVTAHNLAVANRAGIEAIADALEDKREIMGDELLTLLESRADHDPRPRPRRRVRLAAARVLGRDRPGAAAARGPPRPMESRRERDDRRAPGEARRRTSSRPSPPSRSERPERHVTHRPRPERGYRTRFAIIYVALALLAGIGVGAFVVLMKQPEPAPAPKWSAWQPTGSETAQVRQIADQIAKQLPHEEAASSSSPRSSSAPKVTGSTGDVAVSAIAIRPDTSTGKKEENEIDVVPANHSFQYILCGLGTNCSIKGGTASRRVTRSFAARRSSSRSTRSSTSTVRLRLGLPAAAARRSGRPARPSS